MMTDVSPDLSDVSLRDLELFVLASRTNSLRAVARQMDLLPAHTSKIMKSLERKLGVELFRRSAAGIILTPEGIAALEAAEKICDLSREMAPGVLKQESRGEKLWTLGSLGFLSTYLLSPIVCGLQKSSKKSLRFRLMEFTHNDLVAHGLKGAFEIALHIEELEWTRVWESYPAGSLQWKLYGRHDHPLPARCGEADIKKFPFVVPVDWSTHGYVLGEDHCPLPVRRRLRGNEAATAETALEICRHSDQLTFVPEVLAQKWCHFGQMKELTVQEWPAAEKQILLSVKSDVVPRSLVENLLKALKTHPSLKPLP